MSPDRRLCGEEVYPACEDVHIASSDGAGEYSSEAVPEKPMYSEDEEGEDFEGIAGPLRATLCELQDTSPVGGYWLTKLVIAVNFLVALFTGGIFFLTDEFAYKTYPSAACLASGGCFLGVLFSMFSHANFIHLLGNMAYLYIVGDNIEISLGRLRYLIVYLTSGIAGAYTQALITIAFNLPGAHVPMVGASAAISGLIGGYLLLYPGSAMCKCIGYGFVYKCFKVKASSYLAFWVLLQFIYMMISPFIAIWAHLGGFFTGLVLTYFLADRRKIMELREAIARGRRRGLSPYSEDLVEESLGPLARGAIVFAATIMLLLMLTSTILTLISLKGYYIIYLKYGEMFSCRNNICSCYGGFLGVTYNLTKTLPTTLEDIVLTQPSTWGCSEELTLKPLAAYNFYNAPAIAVPLLAITITIFIATIYIMTKKYSEVEVV
jgi:membrane associated rhomboid family serine protease